MSKSNTLNGKPAKLVNEFLAINDLEETEVVLYQVSIHAMDEDLDPPKLSSSNQAHLLRLIQLISSLKSIH
jgi:hypothetical protein